MAEVIQSFGKFLNTLDLSKMIMTLIISNSIADLVQLLIQQFIQPFSKKFIIDTKSEISVAGQKIDIINIINKTLEVFISILIAFVIYLLTK